MAKSAKNAKKNGANVLPMSFFERPVLDVARDLVGCHIVRNIRGKTLRYMLTETEAYDGEKDLGCHASKGRTRRNEPMFGPAGRAYVYFVYGMHWMLNIVTGPRGYPAAVLIRGARDVHSDKLGGPAVLTKRLNVTGDLNGKKLGRAAGLWIEGRAKDFDEKRIRAARRIGIDYAGPVWANKKWRFFVK